VHNHKVKILNKQTLNPVRNAKVHIYSVKDLDNGF